MILLAGSSAIMAMIGLPMLETYIRTQLKEKKNLVQLAVRKKPIKNNKTSKDHYIILMSNSARFPSMPVLLQHTERGIEKLSKTKDITLYDL